MKFLILVFVNIVILTSFSISWNGFWYDRSNYDKEYGHFTPKEKLEMLEATKKMFTFGYDNYMKHAYPEDELNPIYCTGRGHDHEDP